MHKLHHTHQDGWTVHVYGRDRRLLFTLEPSHGWAFAAGTALSLAVAIVAYNLPSSGIPPAPSQPTSGLTAPLQID